MSCRPSETALGWALPWAAGESLLWHLEHLFPPFSMGLCRAGSHILTRCLCGVLPYLKHTFPWVTPSWLQGLAVPCSGAIGAGCMQHGAASAFPRRGPCSPSTSTSPDTQCNDFQSESPFGDTEIKILILVAPRHVKALPLPGQALPSRACG